jgi:hypothetical protein
MIDIDIRRSSRSHEEGPSSDLVAFRSSKARAMLVISSLLSLGLWMAIWLALRSLALAWSLFSWHRIAAAIIVITTSAIVINRGSAKEFVEHSTLPAQIEKFKTYFRPNQVVPATANRSEDPQAEV